MELAKRYNVSIATARKWKGRNDSQDRSHRPLTLATTLSVGQELLVVELQSLILVQPPQANCAVASEPVMNSSVPEQHARTCSI